MLAQYSLAMCRTPEAPRVFPPLCTEDGPKSSKTAILGFAYVLPLLDLVKPTYAPGLRDGARLGILVGHRLTGV